MSVRNPFVSYLRRFYTGEATHQGVFDEYNLSAEDRQYESVLHVHTRVEQSVLKNFCTVRPASVILTGNAGDGKTRICRSVAEKLEGRLLTSWPDGQEYAVQTPTFTLHIIKDLSDYDMPAAQGILKRVSAAMVDGSKDRYLVAANEGKLRHTLVGLDDDKLKKSVVCQLDAGANTPQDNLCVFNLNLEPTSVYVEDLLVKLTSTDNWASCKQCPHEDKCPVLFNRSRLADPGVQERMKFLYEIIEQCGIHVTMRDMLIHLTHTLVGRLSCEAVHHGIVSGDLQSLDHAYYNNAFALNQPPEQRRTLNVVRALSHLQIGEVSSYEVDSFILQGSDDDEHRKLFADSAEMRSCNFERLRQQYLAGQSDATDRRCQHPILELLPHARRKLVFEWSETGKLSNLLALRTVHNFRSILESGSKMATKRVLRDLILGLNRAFSGIYLTDSERLYVTAHLTSAAETQVPLVITEIPKDSLSIVPDAGLNLVIKNDADAPILKIDQLLFECLIRLAEGGTTNLLQDECGLRIRDYKDKLLAHYSGLEDEELTFFVADDTGYSKWQVSIDNGRLILNVD